MISEPLRFNHRDRQSPAIRRASLFHLLVRLRSLANDPRFQSARSVSRPMLRDVDKNPFQYVRHDRSADASQHPRRRDDVPRSREADFTRLLFRYERRRRRRVFSTARWSGIGVHSRYCMPLLPFLFIWASKTALLFLKRKQVLQGIVILCLTWSIGSSLYVFPHEISYCNELVGGSKNAYKHLAKSDSSSDDTGISRDFPACRAA